MSTTHDAYAALRIRDFRLYIILRLINTISFQMLEVVIGWQIFSLTKDPLALGLVGLSSAIPSIGVSLYAGHLSDTKNRRTIALASLAVALVCTIGFLALSFDIQSVYREYGSLPIYLLLFIGGGASGFLAPASIAFSYQLVPQELAPNAAAWRSSAWQTGAIAGPALGGICYGFFGAVGSYGISAALAVIALTLLFLIPSRPPIVREEKESIYDSLKQGIKFVFGNQVIVGALSLDLFAVLFGGAVAMLPIYASDILKIGPEGLGILRAAPSVGAVIVALWMAHRPLNGKVGTQLFSAVAAFGVTIIIFGVSRNVYLSLAMLALGGAFDSVSVIIRSTLLQLSTPNEMRGRVEAVNMMFIGSSNEIGAFESGVAAKILRIVPSVVFGGCMTLVSVFTTSRFTPILRKLTYEELAKNNSLLKK